MRLITCGCAIAMAILEHRVARIRTPLTHGILPHNRIYDSGLLFLLVRTLVHLFDVIWQLCVEISEKLVILIAIASFVQCRRWPLQNITIFCP